MRTTAIDALRGVPWPDEFSFRVVRNKLTDHWAHREAEARAARGSLAEAYAAARERQDFDTVAIVAGEGIGLVHDRPSAASIVQGMVEQAQALLRRGATLDLA